MVNLKTGVSSKCLFFGKFYLLCFLETPVLGFALLPYYRPGDNAGKIWAHRFSAKPKTIDVGDLGGAVSPLWGPGRCHGERVGPNPLSSFFFFFLVQHAKMVIVRVNIG